MSRFDNPIELSVYTDDAAANHLCEKFGFVTEGAASPYALRHGVYVHVYTMARLRGLGEHRYLRRDVRPSDSAG